MPKVSQVALSGPPLPEVPETTRLKLRRELVRRLSNFAELTLAKTVDKWTRRHDMSLHSVNIVFEVLRVVGSDAKRRACTARAQI